MAEVLDSIFLKTRSVTSAVVAVEVSETVAVVASVEEVDTVAIAAAEVALAADVVASAVETVVASVAAEVAEDSVTAVVVVDLVAEVASTAMLSTKIKATSSRSRAKRPLFEVDPQTERSCLREV